jgi:hypothetical protein
MPKDATKNVDRYKTRGGQLNEFELAQDREEFKQGAKKPTTKDKPQKGSKGTKK